MCLNLQVGLLLLLLFLWRTDVIFSSWGVRRWLNRLDTRSEREEFWNVDKFEYNLAKKSRKGLVSHVSGQLDSCVHYSCDVFEFFSVEAIFVCWVLIQNPNPWIFIKGFYHLKIDFWRSDLLLLGAGCLGFFVKKCCLSSLLGLVSSVELLSLILSQLSYNCDSCGETTISC